MARKQGIGLPRTASGGNPAKTHLAGVDVPIAARRGQIVRELRIIGQFNQ
jgi:hypothetical protein